MSSKRGKRILMDGLEIQVIRSSRKTAAIQVTAEGDIQLRVPGFVTDEQVEGMLREKMGWIQKTRKRILERPAIQKEEEKPLDYETVRSLAEEAMAVLPKKTAHYAELIGVSYGRITIRNQKTRWGSCSAKGNLNFNCLLMRAPEEIQDYVVVHELCHRKEMNHSRSFWQEVEKILPDYQERRKWLKEHGKKLFLETTFMENR